MAPLNDYTDKQLLEMLEISQKSLAIMSTDVAHNSTICEATGKRYRPTKWQITIIDERIQEVLRAFGEVRARNYAREQWRRESLPDVPSEIKPTVVSLVYYHPFIQRRFLRTLGNESSLLMRQWATEERKRISEARGKVKQPRSRRFGRRG